MNLRPKVTLCQQLFAIILGLSLIETCSLEEKSPETCAKTLGDKFRCVKPSNCRTEELSNIKLCGKEKIGTCCQIISSLSPKRCGNRQPGVLDDNFHVPRNFKADESYESTDLSNTPQSYSISMISSEATTTTSDITTDSNQSSVAFGLVTESENISDSDITLTEGSAGTPVPAEKLKCDQNISELMSSKNAETSVVSVDAQMSTNTTSVDVQTSTNTTSVDPHTSTYTTSVDVHTSTDTTLASFRYKRNLVDVIHSWKSEESNAEKSYEADEEDEESNEKQDSSSFEIGGYRNLNNGDKRLIPEVERGFKDLPPDVMNPKHEIHYQKPQVRVTEFENWPREVPNMVYAERMNRNSEIVQKRRQKVHREIYGMNPIEVILPALERYLFGHLPTEDFRIQAMYSNLQRFNLINGKLVAISSVLSDYILTGDVPTGKALFFEEILNLVIHFRGFETACKIHPDLVKILKFKRNVVCYKNFPYFIRQSSIQTIKPKRLPRRSRQRVNNKSKFELNHLRQQQHVSTKSYINHRKRPFIEQYHIKPFTSIISMEEDIPNNPKPPSFSKEMSDETENVFDSMLEILFQTGYVHEAFIDLNKDSERNFSHNRDKMNIPINKEKFNMTQKTNTRIVQSVVKNDNNHQNKERNKQISGSENFESKSGRLTNFSRVMQEQFVNVQKSKTLVKKSRELKSQASELTNITNSVKVLEEKNPSTKLDLELNSVTEITAKRTKLSELISIINKNVGDKQQKSITEKQSNQESKSRLKRDSVTVCNDKGHDREFTPKPASDFTNVTHFEDQQSVDMETNREFIVGGRIEEEPWPWLVAIYLEPLKRFVCAGTLFDDQHIISAAHCFQHRKYRNTQRLVVTIGHLRRTDMSMEEDEKVQYHEVSTLFVHEGFTPSCLCNDVAVLRLSSPVTDQYTPACIPDQDPASTGQTVTTMGWGQTQYGSKENSYLLQRIDGLIIYDGDTCRRRLSDASGVDIPTDFGDYYICAGVPDGSKDACVGDSGGPLMFEDYDGYWSLIGVVSFGYKCAAPGIPGTYARISYFIPWITNITMSL